LILQTPVVNVPADGIAVDIDGFTIPVIPPQEGTDPTIVVVIAGAVVNDSDGFFPPQAESPVAVDDLKLNQILGTAVTVQIVSNDTGSENDLDPTTVQLINTTGSPVSTLNVPGEGIWTIDPNTGDITFTPEMNFLGDPAPVNYTIKDSKGIESNTAKVTIDYQEPAEIIGTVWIDAK